MPDNRYPPEREPREYEDLDTGRDTPPLTYNDFMPRGRAQRRPSLPPEHEVYMDVYSNDPEPFNAQTKARPSFDTQEIPPQVRERYVREAMRTPPPPPPGGYEDFNTRPERERPLKQPKAKRRKKVGCGGCLFRMVALALVVVIALGVFAGSYGMKLLNKLDYNPKGLAANQYVDANSLKTDKKVTNILLLGVDRRSTKETSYRSDSMMLLTIDGNNKKIKLTSFMRDSWVDIPGKGHSRLNSACSWGGYQLVKDTIEYNFGIKIDHYALVDFKIFETIVDKIGGVDVEVTKAESNFMKDKFTVPYGDSVHLSGAQALWYCRIRKLDSDFMRTKRQRKVMTAMLQKLQKENIKTLVSLAEEILPLVETDMTKNDIIMLGLKNATSLLKFNIDQMRIPAEDTWKNATVSGMAVLKLDMDKNKAALEQFLYGKDEPAQTTTS